MILSDYVLMNSEEVEALFAQLLLDDDEAEEAALIALHSNGSQEIFDRAAAWCASVDPLKRASGTNILSQLRRARAPGEEWNPGNTERMFCDESYSLITKMLEGEQDPLVLNAAINALGHLYNAEAAPLILLYQDHPDADVRFQVAFALGCFPNDPQSVIGLSRLTSDADEDVRDWAVFGLGVQGDVDSPEIRETLLRCLDDPNDDVRQGAVAGLAKRQDQRVLPKLLTMLDEPRLTPWVAEAPADLLGLEKVPPEWTTDDCKAALKRKFQIPD
jgi:HEAT repeat protein